jgi:hypothetical protein
MLLQAEAYKLQQKDKLRQLELGGYHSLLLCAAAAAAEYSASSLPYIPALCSTVHAAPLYPICASAATNCNCAFKCCLVNVVSSAG